MKAMGIIFSNIYDSALSELTNVRTVASLPFGGRYRLIDFTLSNLSNSGIYTIGIITKYNYRSLMDHLGSCADWDLNRKNEGVTILPPFAEDSSQRVYSGKLEALYTARHFLRDSEADYVVVCDSTILCNIDFRPAIDFHIKSGSDVTMIGCKDPKASAKPLALIAKTDRRNNVTDLMADAQPLDGYYSGMGMFIFGRQYLLDILNETYSKGYVHLERDFLLRQFNLKTIKMALYPYKGIVLRNQDIPSFYANNMRLLDRNVRRGLFLQDAPIYTKIRDEAPTYYAEGSTVTDCLIADGCELYGTAEKSILFRGVNLAEGAQVLSSIIMQDTTIGRGATLEYVILDKDVTVRDGTVLIGTAEHPVIVQKGETI